MAIKYGFFNSVSGDRVYNADDVNSFLEGLITSDGIFANVDDMFQVVTNGGMSLGVGSGKAMINNHWCRNNATETITLEAAHAILNRYDAVVLRLDKANRQIILTTIQGSNASIPTRPNIVRNGSYYDLCLAYVYVSAGTSVIAQADIQDTRLDSDVCGLITGLVQQLDTSQFYSQLEAWKTEQQVAFETWFEDLTEQLNVDTYIQQYEKRVSGVASALTTINLDIPGYVYSPTDIFFVCINGLTAEKTYDYSIDTSGTQVLLHLNLTDTSTNINEVYIRILKSKIGIQ